MAAHRREGPVSWLPVQTAAGLGLLLWTVLWTWGVIWGPHWMRRSLLFAVCGGLIAALIGRARGRRRALPPRGNTPASEDEPAR